jgi:hypothetical protein
MHLALDVEKLDIEDESSVWWNDSSGAGRSISEVRRALQVGALSNAHRGNTLVPAANHLTDADLERERRATVTARVELLAAWCLQVARVVHDHCITAFREASILLNIIIINLFVYMLSNELLKYATKASLIRID